MSTNSNAIDTTTSATGGFFAWWHNREGEAEDKRLWTVYAMVRNAVHVGGVSIGGPAVVDDFGRLVLVGPMQ